MGYLNDLAQDIHLRDNAKWWHDADGMPINRNKGELFALIHSEISEAMEAERTDAMDDKLPHRKGVEVEFADAIIRILDYAGAFDLDLDGALDEKRAYNATRADHKHKNRAKPGGKQW